MMNKVRLKDILVYTDELVSLEDEKEYITIKVRRRFGGLEAREIFKGKDIKTKKQFKLVPHSFIISRVQCWHQAYAIVPDNTKQNMIASVNYDQFKISSDVDLKYFWWFANSRGFTELVRSCASGIVKEKMVFNREKFLSKEILLPSLQEQKISSKKIDKIASNINGLEQLNSINQINITKLRQSILQEAVQGKLTQQNPTDEPASKLLERVKAEKLKLIKEDKLKKEKELPPITDDEIPFGSPKGWVWCRFDDLIIDERRDLRTGPFGSSLNKSEHKNSGVAVLGIESISKQGAYTGFNKIFVTEAKAKELESFYVKGGDLILSRSGTIGELCVLPDDIIPSLISTNLLKISLNGNIIDSTFFCHIVKGSRHIERSLLELCGGTTRLFLTQGILKKLLFPLPPLSEQRHIVTKVQQLMQMVNQLEQQVQQGQTQAQQLLQAVIKEAFSKKGKIYEENKLITIAAEQ